MKEINQKSTLLKDLEEESKLCHTKRVLFPKGKTRSLLLYYIGRVGEFKIYSSLVIVFVSKVYKWLQILPHQEVFGS